MNQNFIAQSFGKSTGYTDIPNNLFQEFNVKKGLRNDDGTGVRVGLTRVSDVVGYAIEDDKKVGIPGKLFYRGIDLEDLVIGKGSSHTGYEEVCFLLLFGYLPNKNELKEFMNALRECYALPKEYLEMNFLRMPSKDLMNLLQCAVLALYNYDEDPDNIDPYETIIKGMNIMAKIPLIISYGYQSQMHYLHEKSLVIHYAKKEYSIAENILYMTREDGKFTAQEAELLDTLLLIHADHGGGNNSTFTNVVISSTNTDIYSTMAGSIGSLKGPRHGGANIRCVNMMKAVVDEIGHTTDLNKIRTVINRIISKDFFDNSGLVYGFGHAVYTITDPRAEILKVCCRKLAAEKGKTKEFDFFENFEVVAKEALYERNGKTVSNNVDFYSGFAYQMMNIPPELYTPLFACSRMVGWLAHNIENKLYDGRIMRPATKYVGESVDYIKMENR